MARKTTRRSPQPTNAQSFKESRDSGERKGHRSETYMRAAIIKATEAGLMAMQGNMIRLRKEGLSLQVLSAYLGTLSLTANLPSRIQDVIQECQDDSLSPRAQRRAHMHCFKAKLKHLKRPLYADLYSFKLRHERERSLSSEPDDHMNMYFTEPEVERCECPLFLHIFRGSSRLLPSTPVKAIVQAHSYPTPESIPRVARLVSRWLPFKLLPSFGVRRFIDSDVDVPDFPTKYCDVGTATSPIANEEDVDMTSPHVNVTSAVPFHQSASPSSGDVNMDDDAGTSSRCAECQQVQADAIEIDRLKEKIEEITKEMTKIKEERRNQKEIIRVRDYKIETLKTGLSKQQDSIRLLLENNADRRRAEEDKRAAVQKELAEAMARQAVEVQCENDIKKLLLDEIDTNNT
ncbi:hypothetical protein EDD18DRAFT_1347493 [Armillaria luteobubalina]|uniref:Uncharacterized protein n=1 Tax=Armillaria luteobubalina TaxID=153913 RepID=A0AA39QEF7_9AGAR|nr:hypothetical protein EDD18DRAFT_1347493 [Armillaria luteobubalina]